MTSAVEARLAERLDARRQREAARRHVLEVASARHLFDPFALRVEGVGATDVVAVAQDAVDTVTGPDRIQRWSVSLPARLDVLAAATAAQVRAWRDEGGDVIDTPEQRLFDDWLGGRLDLERALRDEAGALRDVGRWLARASWPEPAPALVQRRLAEVDALDRLRAVVGPAFVGREPELAELTAVVRSSGRAVIDGRGGLGKSALIARLLLDLGPEAVPVILDLDDPAVDPTESISWFLRIAQQLEPRIEGGRALADRLALEARASRRDGEPDVEVESAVAAAARSFQDSHLVHSVNRLAAMVASSLSPEQRLVVVVDTIERALHVSAELTAQLVGFLDRTFLRPTRGALIVAGRGPLPAELLPDAIVVHLEPLDPDEATAVLLSYGVAPRAKAQRVTELVGCSPLTLRLAAAVVTREGARSLESKELADALERAMIDGYLYRRILGHLPERLRRLAHPGFLLWRLTGDRILRILHDVTEPRIRDAATAEAMLADMRRVHDLVTIDPYDAELGLRVRPEIRSALCRLISEDDPALARRIHERGASYLHGAQRAVDRAERIYHLLALGRRELAEASWGDDVAAFFHDVIDELPAASAAWLRARLPTSTAVSGHASEGDVELARRIDGLLAAGRAREAEQLVDGETKRLRDLDATWGITSPLHLRAARIYRALGNAPRVMMLVDNAYRARVDAGTAVDACILGAWACRRLHDKAGLHRWLELGLEPARELDDSDERAIFMLTSIERERQAGARLPSVKRQLRRRLATDQAWSALGERSRSTQRQAAVVLGDVDSVRAAIRTDALRADRPLPLEPVGDRLSALPERDAASTRETVARLVDRPEEKSWFALLRAAEREQLLAKVLDFILERHGTGRIVLGVRELLQRADEATEVTVDVDARAAALDELRAWIVENVDPRDWPGVVAEVGGRRLAARIAKKGSYDDLVWPALLELDDRGLLNEDLARALAGVTAGDPRYLHELVARLAREREPANEEPT